MGGYQNRNQYEWVPRSMVIVYFGFPAETTNISSASLLAGVFVSWAEDRQFVEPQGF
jgi:hypothetical protein